MSGNGEQVVVSGQDNRWLKFSNEACQHRDAHGADASGRLPSERLVHQQHVWVGVSSHGIDVVAVEVPTAVAREWFCLGVPRWSVIAG
jgi:hypothetical protein